MSEDRYPVEKLHPDTDDGTMLDNVEQLRKAVVGRRIVKVKTVDVPRWSSHPSLGSKRAFVLALDDGTQVRMVDTVDCCAYTELEEVLLYLDLIDHVILGVGTTNEYTTWHIYADLGDVLKLTVGWSCGNPFYYGYGFDICVIPLDGATS